MSSSTESDSESDPVQLRRNSKFKNFRAKETVASKTSKAVTVNQAKSKRPRSQRPFTKSINERGDQEARYMLRLESYSNTRRLRSQQSCFSSETANAVHNEETLPSQDNLQNNVAVVDEGVQVPVARKNARKSYSNIIRLRSQKSCSSFEAANEVQIEETLPNQHNLQNNVAVVDDGVQVPVARQKARKSYSNIIRLRSQQSCSSFEAANEVQNEETLPSQDNLQNIVAVVDEVDDEGVQVPVARQNARKSFSNIIRLRSQQSCSSFEAANEVQNEETLPSQDNLQNNVAVVDEEVDDEGLQVPVARKKARTCWEVDVTNEAGIVKKKKLKSVDVWDLHPGLRVIVPFDRFGAPTTDAAGLYAGVLSTLATESWSFPINYNDWRLLPTKYKDDIFEKTIKAKFHFQDDRLAKDWTLKNIGKKWKDFKCRLWIEFYDPSSSRDKLIMNCPEGIPQDQWASFVNYRLSKKSKEMCKKNAENRRQQKFTHACGSKSFARKRSEMEIELGRAVTRTEVWLETHRKNNEAYLNDEVRKIAEQVMKEVGQTFSSQSQSVSQDDPLGRVLGKEHPGRVRGLGFGPSPSTIFGSTSRAHNDNQMKEYVTNLEKELEATKSQIKDIKKTFGGVLVGVLQNAFGQVPEGFATWLNQTCATVPDEGSDHQQDEGSGHQRDEGNTDERNARGYYLSSSQNS